MMKSTNQLTYLDEVIRISGTPCTKYVHLHTMYVNLPEQI